MIIQNYKRNNVKSTCLLTLVTTVSLGREERHNALEHRKMCEAKI